MAAGILIVGTGAMACLFAARLAAAGAAVTMLGSWREGLRALQQDGVCLEEDGGVVRCYPVRAVDDPGQCAGIPLACVLVKAWQTGRAAGQLAACLPADGVALSLQNGLGNGPLLAQALGPQRVGLGTTTMGATLLAPGRVRPGGSGTITVERQPRLAPLLALFRQAGLAVEETGQLQSLLWGKLVINAGINPLAALLRLPNGELLHRPGARALMAAAALEAATVAAALGVPLPYPDPVAAVEGVAERTATNRASMLQDVLRGAPTEIDAICGAIVRAGQDAGIETPVNRTLWQLVGALSPAGS